MLVPGMPWSIVFRTEPGTSVFYRILCGSEITSTSIVFPLPGLGRTMAGPDCLVCGESELGVRVGVETVEGNITYVNTCVLIRMPGTS